MKEERRKRKREREKEKERERKQQKMEVNSQFIKFEMRKVKDHYEIT